MGRKTERGLLAIVVVLVVVAALAVGSVGWVTAVSQPVSSRTPGAVEASRLVLQPTP